MPKKSINKPKSAGSKPTEKFNPKAVTPKILLGWMESRGLSEIEFENEDFLFRASKKTGMEFNPGSFISSINSGGDSATATASGKAAVTESSTLKKILSPFVGTFYRSSSPESEPFVKEGQRVSKGDTLCIIEAMKLMNEIEAEIQGRISSVLIENGQPVEFGEPLFLVEPDL